MECEHRKWEISLEGELSPGSEEPEVRSFCKRTGLHSGSRVLRETNSPEQKAERVGHVGEGGVLFHGRSDLSKALLFLKSKRAR